MLLIPRYDGPSGNPSVISENQIPGCRNHEQHILNTLGRFPRAAAGSILSSPLRGSLSLEAAILIPVFLTRSDWAHFRSPSRVDSKIRTIAALLSLEYSGFCAASLDIDRDYRFSI